MGYQNFFATKLYNDIGAADNVITLETPPTVTSGRLVLEARNPTQREIISYTNVSGNQITGVTRGLGGTSAKSHLKNSLVEMNVVAEDLSDALNAPNDVITRFDENLFDFVAAGCVWTADAPGATRNASMTSGVVYINGRRIAVSAVNARTFTASKDTYVDVSDTGTITYTEVATNANSPALAANSIRLAIVPTGAVSILGTTAGVNQGQEDRTAPSNVSGAYAVTDSLGNLICPRDPNRKLLGYRQSTNSSNVATGAAQILLTCPVIVPAGRKVKITIGSANLSNNSIANTSVYIQDGATVLGQASFTAAGANYVGNGYAEATQTPTTSNKTYTKTGNTSAGTGTVVGSYYIKVELE